MVIFNEIQGKNNISHCKVSYL